MNTLLLIIFGYLCGSVPFGKIVAHHRGVDIQRRGSGNIGFANVRRILGWRAGLLTLGGDILKGLVPCLIALNTRGELVAFWVGVAAIVGHIFPVWLKFRGGKGIATGLGVMLVLQPVAACIGFAAYAFGALVFKRSFIGSLLGALVVVILGSLTDSTRLWQYGLLLMIATWTLRQNIFGTLPDHDK
jgi:acyl phosphate:glycerol-3-phosphate acyltransferase